MSCFYWVTVHGQITPQPQASQPVIHSFTTNLVTQDEESKRLHDELVQARKEADRVRLDRAETVNRLTKSLEQSQKQNEELLNSGTVRLYHIFVPLTILSSTQTFSVGRCIRRTGGGVFV